MIQRWTDRQDRGRFSEQSAYHVLVQGNVTGVGFRFSANNEARRHGCLQGYIRNKNSTTVECLVQGPEPSVSQFVDWLQEGPPGAGVKNCEINEVGPQPDLPSFHIAR